MACLQAGTVLSATVEQVLENCLLVCVKHRSKIFRGVLFDEKNAAVWRTSLDEQTTSLESMKEKMSGGSNLSDGASRWSTRQASMFYRRQNNRSFPCRRIPSSFRGIKVLTDADLIKEGMQESSENMVEKLSTTTKRPSASDQQTKQEQVIKAKETSRRKTSLSSQVDGKHSELKTNLKRKSSNQESCDRPSKRKSDIERVVSKGVQKQTDKKRTKGDCKSPQKTEVNNGGARSLGSKDSTAKGISSTHYKVLMTRPCSVPVVPVGTAASAGQRQHGTVLVLKKVQQATGTRKNRLSSSKSLASVVSRLTDGNMTGVHKNINDNKDQNQEKQPDPKTRVDENKDDTISERTVPIKEGSVPNTLTDDSESGATTCLHDIAGESSITPQCGIQKDFERKTMDENSVSIAGEDSNTSQCGIQNDFETKTMNKNSVSIAGEDSNTPQCGIQKDFERKTMNENSVSSDNAERMEIQKSMPENVTIKRSARISEKRANTLQTQPKSEKLGHEKSSAESNETKTVGQDSSQVNTVSKTLSHNISNQPAKREMASTILTQQNPLKHKSTTSSTKYTQRMSWILQPQKAPVDNINPVSVNDIVWGKVHGHPWWPGRVLAISGIRNEESSNQLDRDAHVSWFGSNTSSIMRVHGLQLFLPYFDKRHKRHKKGYYRLAVRQAQEALQVTAVKDR